LLPLRESLGFSPLQQERKAGFFVGFLGVESRDSCLNPEPRVSLRDCRVSLRDSRVSLRDSRVSWRDSRVSWLDWTELERNPNLRRRAAQTRILGGLLPEFREARGFSPHRRTAVPRIRVLLARCAKN
jgi:hypothetical protein